MMSNNNILGIYWGREGFGCVLTEGGKPLKSFYTPFSDYKVGSNAFPVVADEMKNVSLIQKVLQEHSILTQKVALAIPSYDVIIRTFVIPVVKPAELDGVVSFEAKKYVPFSLVELKYTFDAYPIVEDNVKKMRILFVAVRKETYDQYIATLTQAGLNIYAAEPASISLIRALHSKNLLSDNKCIAAVQLTKDEGKITIINEGLPIFVRDFSLTSPSSVPDETIDPEMIRSKFFNEVKMSLDFFNRQFQRSDIDELLFVAPPDRRQIWEGFEHDFNVSCRSYDPNSIIQSDSAPDMGLLSAFGVALSGKNNDLDVFGFHEREVGSRKNIKRRKVKEENAIDYKKLTKPFFLAMTMLLGVYFGTDYFIQEKNKILNTTKVELEEFADMELEDIENQEKNKIKELKSYQSIPLKSDLLYLLSESAKELPENVWLTNLDYNSQIQQDEDKKKRSSSSSKKMSFSKQVEKLTLSLNGRVYKENPNEQIQIANQYLSKLRNNEKFSSYFDAIQLQNVKSENVDGVRVLNFTIFCEDLYE